jgi:hypothetical protein
MNGSWPGSNLDQERVASHHQPGRDRTSATAADLHHHRGAEERDAVADVADRIKAAVPDVRLIALLSNPVDRA